MHDGGFPIDFLSPHDSRIEVKTGVKSTSLYMATGCHYRLPLAQIWTCVVNQQTNSSSVLHMTGEAHHY